MYKDFENNEWLKTKIHNVKHNNNHFMALCPGLPGEPVPEETPTHHPDHHPIFSFFHLPRSTASSLFKLCAWQSFCTTSLHLLFRLPLGLEPATSHSIHFFTQSVSSFCNTCLYHRNLFCCSINIISPIPSLSLNSLLGRYLNITHPSDHSHLCLLKCHLIFSLTGQVSLPCSIIIMSGYNHNIKAWIWKKCHIVSTLVSTLQQKNYFCSNPYVETFGKNLWKALV